MPWAPPRGGRTRPPVEGGIPAGSGACLCAGGLLPLLVESPKPHRGLLMRSSERSNAAWIVVSLMVRQLGLDAVDLHFKRPDLVLDRGRFQRRCPPRLSLGSRWFLWQR